MTKRKPEIVQRDGYHEIVLRQYRDIPYTVFGCSSVPTTMEVAMKGDGLRAVVRQMRKGDDLRIVFGAEIRFEILRGGKPR